MFYYPSFPSLFFFPFSQPITTERNQSQSKTPVTRKSSFVVFHLSRVPRSFQFVFAKVGNTNYEANRSQIQCQETPWLPPGAGATKSWPTCSFTSCLFSNSSEKSPSTSRPTCVSRARPTWPFRRPARPTCTWSDSSKAPTCAPSYYQAKGHRNGPSHPWWTRLTCLT